MEGGMPIGGELVGLKIENAFPNRAISIFWRGKGARSNPRERKTERAGALRGYFGATLGSLRVSSDDFGSL